ncbi:MAG: TetR/AcrR family transcriptional regulator [Clostridia bacterium]|nr:TetR/AcrR family transcriptional regulator [Clostridia bacterium]
MAYRTPKDVQERKDLRKKCIMDTASRVFSQKGYHATTVKDIVDEAGISVGSFYFYFKNKEDLFEALFDEMISLLIQGVESSIYNVGFNAIEKVCRAVFHSLWILQSNKELSKIMMIEAVGLNERFESKRLESNKKILDMVQKSLQISKDNGDMDFPDLKIAALAYFGSVFNVVSYWLQEDNGQNLIDSSYPLSIFILQALKIDFVQNQVKVILDQIKLQCIHSMKEDSQHA